MYLIFWSSWILVNIKCPAAQLFMMLLQKMSTRRQHYFLPAAAKSLQSCPTLCDPIEGSPPYSPVPGILKARTLEQVAISFSNAWKWKVKSESEVAQSCPTLRDPMDCSLPGCSAHGIFQARVLEWVAIAFSSGKLSLWESWLPGLWIREECARANTQGLGSHFFPLRLHPSPPDSSHSGALLPAEVPRRLHSQEGGFSWGPQHQETWRKVTFPRSLWPEGQATIRWVHWGLWSQPE